MEKIKVSWTRNDFVDLDYDTILAYKTKPFANYTQQIYKQIISVDAYHLPKTMPQFVEQVIHHFGHKITAPAINRMVPGSALPPHQDEYKKFIVSYNVQDINDITRYLIFLEDSRPGQMIQIESNMITEWQAGNYVYWRGSTVHSAYNLSDQNRYILQLTSLDKI